MSIKDSNEYKQIYDKMIADGISTQVANMKAFRLYYKLYPDAKPVTSAKRKLKAKDTLLKNIEDNNPDYQLIEYKGKYKIIPVIKDVIDEPLVTDSKKPKR